MSSFSSEIALQERASISLESDRTQLLEFDAVLNETHQGDVAISDHPVEEGSDITDHVRRNPDSLTCRIVVSNYPIVIARSLNAKPSVPGGDPNSRAEDAYGFLREIKDGVKLVRFSTTIRDYIGVVISSLSLTRDASSSNIVDITLSIREIIIATTETTEVPEPVNPSRKKKVPLGKKPKPDATPATEAKTQSTLAQIFSAFRG